MGRRIGAVISAVAALVFVSGLLRSIESVQASVVELVLNTVILSVSMAAAYTCAAEGPAALRRLLRR